MFQLPEIDSRINRLRREVISRDLTTNPTSLPHLSFTSDITETFDDVGDAPRIPNRKEKEVTERPKRELQGTSFPDFDYREITQVS